MEIIDACVKYEAICRYVIPSIITPREITLEDAIHKLGKIYLSIYPQIAHFSGIGKKLPTFLLICIVLLPLNLSLRTEGAAKQSHQKHHYENAAVGNAYMRSLFVAAIVFNKSGKKPKTCPRIV